MFRNKVLATIFFCLLLLSVIVQPVFSRYVLSDVGTILTSIVNGSAYTVTYYDVDGKVFYRHMEYSGQGHTLIAVQNATASPLVFTLSDGTTKEMPMPDNAVSFDGWVTVTDQPVTSPISKSIALKQKFTYQQAATQTFTVTYMDSSGTNIVATKTFDNSKTGDEYKYIGKTPSVARVEFPSTVMGEDPRNPGDPEKQIFRPDLDPNYQELLDLTDQGMAFVYWEVRSNGEAVAWDSYTLPQSNVVVYPHYDYAGSMGLQPVDSDEDGTTDYYKVVPVPGETLPQDVVILGNVNGIPVKEIVDLFTSDTTGSYAEQVKTITIGEGLEIIGNNGLGGTPNLTKVSLPSTLTELGERIFTVHHNKDGKKLHIVYAGTMAQWDYDINKANAWDVGLAEGTLLQCSDGYKIVQSAKGNSRVDWSDWTDGPPPDNVIPNQ